MGHTTRKKDNAEGYTVKVGAVRFDLLNKNRALPACLRTGNYAEENPLPSNETIGERVLDRIEARRRGVIYKETPERKGTGVMLVSFAGERRFHIASWVRCVVLRVMRITDLI